MNKRLIRQLCNTEHPVLFEIGCADGIDTLDFITVFDDLDFELHCFEPYEANAIAFKERIKDGRVKFYQTAIGNFDGNVDFNVSLNNNMYSSSLREPGDSLFRIWNRLFPNKSSFGKTKVKSVTLDTFVKENNFDIIDFIWMDVQGAEDLVIAGGKNTFESKVRYLYTEYSDDQIYIGEPTLQQILRLLPGYTIVENFPNATGDLLGGDVLLKNNILN